MLEQSDLEQIRQIVEEVVEEKVDPRFEQIDARFEQIDARFEQIDARFEQIDARFEQVDARFEEFGKRVDARFEEFEDAVAAGFRKTAELIRETRVQSRSVDNMILKEFDERLIAHEERITLLEQAAAG